MDLPGQIMALGLSAETSSVCSFSLQKELKFFYSLIKTKEKQKKTKTLEQVKLVSLNICRFFRFVSAVAI